VNKISTDAITKKMQVVTKSIAFFIYNNRYLPVNISLPNVFTAKYIVVAYFISAVF